MNVRLAYNPGPVNQYKALEPPTVRLAYHNEGKRTLSTPLDNQAPALLVSFVYLPGFLKNRHRYHFRDWVLDSGAFSAHNSGTVIDLQAYIDTAKELLANDPQLTEVFALDVIGDHKASMRNCEEMWKQGVPAIPCFHRGTDWSELVSLAKNYPKIALGGVAMLRGNEKMNFAQQAFARIWPARVHGFGYGSEKQVMGLPWHSVDATNWEAGPCRFGRWQSFGKMSVRGSQQNLRAEVEWYLALERKAQFRWRKEMAKLATLPPAPAVRLALGGNMRDAGEQREEALRAPGTNVRLALPGLNTEGGATGFKNMERALGPAPTVRLAVSGGTDAGKNLVSREVSIGTPAVRKEAQRKPRPQQRRKK